MVMPQKIYIVEGRQFRTETDQKLALRDQQLIEKLMSETDFSKKDELEGLLGDLKQKKYRFYTILGADFQEKVEEAIQKCDNDLQKESQKESTMKKSKKAQNTKPTSNVLKEQNFQKMQTRQKNSDAEGINGNEGNTDETALIEKLAREELRKREKRRRGAAFLCFVLGSLCIVYFVWYFLQSQRTQNRFEELAKAREQAQDSVDYSSVTVQSTSKESVHVNLDSSSIVLPDILEKYKSLYNSNKKLIGWLKIDDTRIDYPVMQTTDNEYYLKHNIDQQEDRNGALFLDKDCKIYPQGTNLIIYGHHMQSGVMFGTLDKYSSEEFYEKHKEIEFDTIYEEGIYDVMYVFRSRIYNEDDMVFKYYQFTEAMSEQEFDSYMEEMKSMSLYDTDVEAQFGDHLLTLSTCDYYVKDGRFVVVAKKRE